MSSFVTSVDNDLCAGCRICETVCSLGHESECNPRKSRIHVVKVEEKAIYIPVVCHQCRTPSCKAACPMNAIEIDAATKVVLINEGQCTGCGLCVAACPFGSMSLHPENKVAMKCDLCGGMPKCTELCPTNVLQFASPSELGAIRRRFAVQGRMEAVLRQREEFERAPLKEDS